MLKETLDIKAKKLKNKYFLPHFCSVACGWLVSIPASCSHRAAPPPSGRPDALEVVVEGVAADPELLRRAPGGAAQPGGGARGPVEAWRTGRRAAG